MSVASTIVPVATFSPMAARCRCHLVEQPPPRSCASSRWRNRHTVVSSGTGSQPRSMYRAGKELLYQRRVADSTVLPDLLHGNETRVWGDQAYRGQRAVIRQHAPRARDFVNRRYRHRGVVDEAKRAKNRTKTKVRAKVEHPIGIIKRVFGFAKVRYRGLNKNTHRLLVTCALANLFMARRHLLRCDAA